MVKTDEEWEIFHHSKRTLDSCKREFDSLKELYFANKEYIKDVYNSAILGNEDPLFSVSAQKEFYGRRLKIIDNARHNLFFKISKYEQIFE